MPSGFDGAQCVAHCGPPGKKWRSSLDTVPGPLLVRLRAGSTRSGRARPRSKAGWGRRKLCLASSDCSLPHMGSHGQRDRLGANRSSLRCFAANKSISHRVTESCGRPRHNARPGRWTRCRGCSCNRFCLGRLPSAPLRSRRPAHENGRFTEAREEIQRAMTMTHNLREQELLTKRLKQMDKADSAI